MQSHCTIATNIDTAGQVTGLYEQYYKLAVEFAKQRLTCPELSEDVVQEVFTRILEKNIEVSVIENRKAYLFVMVRNEVINYLRREKLQKQIMTDAMWHNQDTTTHDAIMEREYRKTLQAAIERLPVQRRKVYQLSFEYGMKSDAIANELNIAKNTVRRQLQLARREVRSYMWMMVA